MKTPAVTIVAAWIKAETGVGPSIASGSQVCSGICADFPIAPMNRQDAGEGQRIDLPAEKLHCRADGFRRCAKDGAEVERAEDHKNRVYT